MFVLSQLMSAITQPVFWLALWWGVALLVISRWRRAAMGMLWLGLAVLGLLGFEALPHALLRPLENQYPVPTAAVVDRHVGVVVLGGATQHPRSYQAHAQVPLGEAAERMSVPVGLLRQHPKLALVFSGGEGRLRATGVTEAELARVFGAGAKGAAQLVRVIRRGAGGSNSVGYEIRGAGGAGVMTDVPCRVAAGGVRIGSNGVRTGARMVWGGRRR
jgi:hypothetical protein